MFRCYENNLPSGVHNSSNCKGMCVFMKFFLSYLTNNFFSDKKTPLFLSFPHFYGADHYFIDQLDKKSELKPEKDKHGSRMIIEKVRVFSRKKSVTIFTLNFIFRKWEFQSNFYSGYKSI